MAITQNTQPVYSIPLTTVQFGKITAADTGTDGTGANVVVVATGKAVTGSYVSYIKLQPISTSGSTTTSAAVARLYLNNGGPVGTASSNILLAELTLTAAAVNTAATLATVPVYFTWAGYLPPSARLMVGINAMAASTQWNAGVWMGDY